MQCLIGFLSNFENDLEYFDNKRKNLEKALLAGDYISSANILDDIQTKLGKSLWATETALLISNFSIDIIDSEYFYRTLKDETKEDFFVHNFIRTFRRKTNTNTMPTDTINFIKRREDLFEKRMDIPFYKKAYYTFMNNQFSQMEISSYFPLLIMAAHLNITDMFLLLDKLVIEFLSSDYMSHDNKLELMRTISNYNIPLTSRIACLSITSKTIVEDRQTKLIYNSKKEICNSKDFEYLNLLKSEFPNNFDTIMLIVQNEIMNNYAENNINDKNLFQMIHNVIYSFTVKNGDYNDFYLASLNAMRMTLLLSCTTLYNPYCYFYQIISEGNTNNKLKYIFSCNYNNRDIYAFFTNKGMYFKHLQLYENYDINWIDGSINPNLIYDKISIGINKNNSTDFDISMYNTATQQEAIILDKNAETIFNKYVFEKKANEAVKLYVDLHFLSKFKVCNFNNKLLNKQIVNLVFPYRNELYSTVEFCIYADLTDFNADGIVDLRLNPYVADSFVQILRSNNICFPSEIVNVYDINSNNKAKYAYFLRHICDEFLMDNLLNFFISEEINEQLYHDKIFEERIKVLKLAIDLDDESEVNQIYTQIELVQEKRQNNNMKDLESLIFKSKLFEEDIQIEQSGIIYPFFINMQLLLNTSNSDNFNDYSSGEFQLFRDMLVKYKKVYIDSLDKQLGNTIRHGTFANEIKAFFKSYGIKLLDLDPHNKTREFSQKLHIHHTSKENNFKSNCINNYDGQYIYISDYKIADIAKKVIFAKDAYEFESVLKKEISNFVDEMLNKMGEQVEQIIINEYSLYTKNYLNQEQPIKSTKLSNTIIDEIPSLARRIREWFKFCVADEQICSVESYFNKLIEIYPYVKYNLDSHFPKFIKYKYLRHMNAALNNLIINANEHSLLDPVDLNISINVKINGKRIVFNISNSLSEEVDIKKIKTQMKYIEKTIHNMTFENENDRGRGFYIISNTLNSLCGKNWKFSFSYKKLPSEFKVNIIIDRRKLLG